MTTAKIEVTLDRDKCQGYGMCLGVDDVFEMEPGASIARVKLAVVDASREAEIEMAARDCPACAISHRRIEG